MRKYAWHGAFVPRDFLDGPIDVADSWRHSSGSTNGLSLHIERFTRTAGPLPAGFVDAMLTLLSTGELFPVSYTHLTLPTILRSCRSRWSPYH